LYSKKLQVLYKASAKMFASIVKLRSDEIELPVSRI